MAAATEGFIHLSRPLAPSSIGLQSNLAPLSVNIHPQVRFLLPP
jgi:translation initiation factor 3 subunit F